MRGRRRNRREEGREPVAGRVRQRVREDENGEEEERSPTSVGDPEHRAFLRFALSFNRAFRACSKRARTEEPERSAIGETGPIPKIAVNSE